MYPTIRMRRTRYQPWLRELLAETKLTTHDLILPIFVTDSARSEEIRSMPGIMRYSLADLPKLIRSICEHKILAVALFPHIKQNLRTDDAREAFNENNLICQAIQQIRQIDEKIGIICDVALDPYTSHGHDGIIINNEIDNDKTVELLCKQAALLAKAGCDIIAPSDMMDGRIGAIRTYLDEENYNTIPILSYAVKYASNFYGPFRDAVGTDLKGKNKASYQVDYRNFKETFKEVELDIAEGADIVMVKPALAYLDVIHALSNSFEIPIFAYQVSGEYSMIKAAADNHWLNYQKVMLESLICIKRAGARAIFSYAALDVAEFLLEGSYV